MPPQPEAPPTHELVYLGSEHGYRYQRVRYRKPFRVGSGYFATEERARARAQKLADAEGRPVSITNLAEGRRLPDVLPNRYLCPNRNCRAEITAAQWCLAYRVRSCPQCTTDFPDATLAALSWADCPWPEWVPVWVRTEIAKQQRDPAQWLVDAWEYSAPALGAVVVAWAYAGDEIDRRVGRYLSAKRRIAGRFIYGWPNVGFVVQGVPRRKVSAEQGATAEYICAPAVPRDCTRWDYTDWLAEGERRFGPDRNAWRFRCPLCTHSQSVRSVCGSCTERDAEVWRWIKHQCANPGCSYTPYIRTVRHCEAVRKDGVFYPVFPFGTETPNLERASRC